MSFVLPRLLAVALVAFLGALPIASANAQARLAPGTEVVVRFDDGSTVDWPGTVDRVGSDGRVFVKFKGMVAPDDQWVAAKLVRATGGAPKAPAPQPAPQPTATEKKAAASPTGRFRCTTFDAGLLNIVADFTLGANGTYVDHLRKGSGRWTHDARTSRVRFTSGPQKTTADVRYEPNGPRGKPRLRFTYPGGAILDCSR